MTKTEAREILFTLVFESEFNPEKDAETIYNDAIESRGFENYRYIKKGLSYIKEHKSELVDIIENHSDEWKFNRMSAATRAILLIATYDMKVKELVPDIAINEAINLSKKYDDESAAPFVNGVLAAIVKESAESSTDEE